MMKKQILVGAGLLVVVGIGFGAVALAGPQAQGKIAPWDAMKAATAKLGGGTAYQATYLIEGGKPMYDVVVIKNKKLSEVEVDAVTGKAGTVEEVTPAEEGQELVDQLNVALGKKKATLEKDEKDEKNEKSEKPLKKGKG